MAKIQNISEIHPTLGFTEFDVLEKYRKSFNESELGRLYSVFPLESMAKAAGLSEQHLGRRNIFSPSAKIAIMDTVQETFLSVSCLLLFPNFTSQIFSSIYLSFLLFIIYHHPLTTKFSSVRMIVISQHTFYFSSRNSMLTECV